MSIESTLLERSASKCEFCNAVEGLGVYEVPPDSKATVDDSILLCETCREQIENPEKSRRSCWICSILMMKH